MYLFLNLYISLLFLLVKCRNAAVEKLFVCCIYCLAVKVVLPVVLFSWCFGDMFVLHLQPTWWSVKSKPRSFDNGIISSSSDFLNSFTGKLSSKFVVKQSLMIPPHFAVLPCEYYQFYHYYHHHHHYYYHYFIIIIIKAEK